MDKNTKIVIIASIVIVASIGYSVFSAVSLGELEVKWNERGSFDYMTMLNGGVIEVCNPSDIQLGFNSLGIVALYQENEVGRFDTEGAVVQPNSAIEILGKGETTSLAGQIMSMYLDTEISGTEVIRIDSEDMSIVTSIDTVLLGVIPYSVSSTYTGQEFYKIMNGQTEEYSC